MQKDINDEDNNLGGENMGLAEAEKPQIEQRIEFEMQQLEETYKKAAGVEFELIKQREILEKNISDLDSQLKAAEKNRESAAYKLSALQSLLK